MIKYILWQRLWFPLQQVLGQFPQILHQRPHIPGISWELFDLYICRNINISSFKIRSSSFTFVYVVTSLNNHLLVEKTHTAHWCCGCPCEAIPLKWLVQRPVGSQLWQLAESPFSFCIAICLKTLLQLKLVSCLAFKLNDCGSSTRKYAKWQWTLINI